MWTLKRYNNINDLLINHPDYNNYVYVVKNDKSDDIYNMIKNGHKCKDICNSLNISSKTYYKYIDLLGLPKIDKQRKNKEEIYNKILDLYGTKKNKEIINELNISSTLFYNLLKKKKLILY